MAVARPTARITQESVTTNGLAYRTEVLLLAGSESSMVYLIWNGVVQPTRASTLHQVERVTVCETSKIWGRFRVPQGAADRAEADRGRQAGRQVCQQQLHVHSCKYKSYSVIDIQPSMGHTVTTNRCARPVALSTYVVVMGGMVAGERTGTMHAGMGEHAGQG
jgi:hypothetical protein